MLYFKNISLMLIMQILPEYLKEGGYSAHMVFCLYFFVI